MNLQSRLAAVLALMWAGCIFSGGALAEVRAEESTRFRIYAADNPLLSIELPSDWTFKEEGGLVGYPTLVFRPAGENDVALFLTPMWPGLSKQTPIAKGGMKRYVELRHDLMPNRDRSGASSLRALKLESGSGYWFSTTSPANRAIAPRFIAIGGLELGDNRAVFVIVVPEEKQGQASELIGRLERATVDIGPPLEMSGGVLIRLYEWVGANRQIARGFKHPFAVEGEWATLELPRGARTVNPVAYRIPIANTQYDAVFPGGTFVLAIANDSLPYYYLTDDASGLGISFVFHRPPLTPGANKSPAGIDRPIDERKALDGDAIKQFGDARLIEETLEVGSASPGLRQHGMRAYYLFDSGVMMVRLSNISRGEFPREKFTDFIKSMKFMPRIESSGE